MVPIEAQSLNFAHEQFIWKKCGYLRDCRVFVDGVFSVLASVFCLNDGAALWEFLVIAQRGGGKAFQVTMIVKNSAKCVVTRGVCVFVYRYLCLPPSLWLTDERSVFCLSDLRYR